MRPRPCITCGTLTYGPRCRLHNRSGWAAWRQDKGKEYGSEWAKTARQVLIEEPFCRCGPDCCPGGCNRRSTDCDHKVPRSMGGTDARWNLQGLAGDPCHKRKTHRDQQRLQAMRRGAA